MHRAHRAITAWLTADHVLYVAVFFFMLCANVFMFRGIIAAEPSVARGDTVIARDELIPFFSFHDQFWSESTSSLTNSEEIRVVYSFWTSWVRYFTVMPLAFPLLGTISAFMLFHALYMITRRFGPSILLCGVAAAMTAFFVYFVLLYAKITDFYTLVFGFSLFAWSISLVLEQLFAKSKLSAGNVVGVSLLTLFNPAIHYHVIFYVTLALVIIAQLAIATTLEGGRAGARFLRRDLLYAALVILGSLFPYVIYIGLAAGHATASVSTQIPVNYAMVFYSSIALPYLFGFDTTSQIDMALHGNYLVPAPRVLSMIVVGLIIALFLTPGWQQATKPKRIFIWAMLVGMILAMWMSLGYSPSTPFSFHFVLRDAALFLAGQGNIVAHALSAGLAIFINILRFPHRFQFIYFYFAGILAAIALAWIAALVHRQTSRAWLAALCIIVLVSVPIAGDKDYQAAAITGTFGSYLKPYPIPRDLVRIKAILAHTPKSKVFILPTLESGRTIEASGTSYGFIDKFLIYYLNQSTVYYGTGGDTTNKIIAALVYNAIEHGQTWWQDVLIRDLGITHILEPKHTVPRTVGYTYLPDIGDKVEHDLKRSDFTLAYNGSDYALYTAKPSIGDSPPTLVDLPWGELDDHFGARTNSTGRFYFPLQLRSLLRLTSKIDLATDNVARSAYDMYAAEHGNRVFYPASSQLAFMDNVVASSQYTNIALSMSILDNSSNRYNLLAERLPSLVNMLTPQFVGIAPGEGSVDVSFVAPRTGAYRIAVHAATNAGSLTSVMGGQQLTLRRLTGDENTPSTYADFSYFYVDVQLIRGSHTLIIQPDANDGIAVESLALIPSRDVPMPQPDGSVSTATLAITPSNIAQLYTVRAQRIGR